MFAYGSGHHKLLELSHKLCGTFLSQPPFELSIQVPSSHSSTSLIGEGMQVPLHLELHSLAGYSWHIDPSFPSKQDQMPFFRSDTSNAETIPLLLTNIFPAISSI